MRRIRFLSVFTSLFTLLQIRISHLVTTGKRKAGSMPHHYFFY